MAVGRTFMVTGVHLGPAANGDPRKFNESVLPAGGQLGGIYEQDGKFFRLVKFDNGSGNVAAIDGGVLHWLTKSTYVATTDASDGEGTPNDVAGGTHVVATDLNYIFIQVGGDQAAVVTTAAGAIGAQLSGHASTDNALVPTAAGTAAINQAVGVQLSAQGSRTSDNGASVANSVKCRWILGAVI